MKILHMVAFGLTIVGAVNWGLIGLLDINLVSMILGAGSGIEKNSLYTRRRASAGIYSAQLI